MKISVITVVKNDARGFEKTAQSVLSQNYPKLEWIVIDGGSTDSTVDVIRKYERRISYWCGEADRGIYEGMNKGLARATGKWVNFMNAGDTFVSPDSISKVFAHDFAGYGVVYGDGLAIYPQGRVYKHASPAHKLWKGMAFCHPASFIRTNLIIEKGFDLQYSIGGDFNMMFGLAAGGCRFLHIPFPVAAFDTSGVSNRKMAKSARENFAIVRSYQKLVLRKRIYHYGFILWTGIVSVGYRFFPIRMMHRLSLLYLNRQSR